MQPDPANGLDELLLRGGRSGVRGVARAVGGPGPSSPRVRFDITASIGRCLAAGHYGAHHYLWQRALMAEARLPSSGTLRRGAGRG